LAVDAGELSSLHMGCFTHGERYPGLHWTRGLMCLIAVLNMVMKRKLLAPTGNWTLLT